ncbi:hypothetical protein ALC53_11467 [Atta colombica]|uniref:Uncharacterized protein n=1 Tax=Atta colombica TaxID=520822 RepID=A0A195B131_9HYME|nr:hypothetical protein ALC53_11467 [Atta colombica]
MKTEKEEKEEEEEKEVLEEKDDQVCLPKSASLPACLSACLPACLGSIALRRLVLKPRSRDVSRSRNEEYDSVRLLLREERRKREEERRRGAARRCDTGRETAARVRVCVTVPHRALTAPRRVASLKSRLAPTCLTRSNGDWSLLPATAAIGTSTELSENFPRYIVRFISPTPTCFVLGLTWGEKWDRTDQRKGETLEREEVPRMNLDEFFKSKFSHQR